MERPRFLRREAPAPHWMSAVRNSYEIAIWQATTRSEARTTDIEELARLDKLVVGRIGSLVKTLERQKLPFNHKLSLGYPVGELISGFYTADLSVRKVPVSISGAIPEWPEAMEYPVVPVSSWASDLRTIKVITNGLILQLPRRERTALQNLAQQPEA
jgi:hypothetical protein